VATDAPTGGPAETVTDAASGTAALTARTPTVVADHQTMPVRRTGAGWPGVRPGDSNAKRPRTETGAVIRPPRGPPDPIAHRLSAQTACAARLPTLWPAA
jgi:hypothetical protein